MRQAGRQVARPVVVADRPPEERISEPVAGAGPERQPQLEARGGNGATPGGGGGGGGASLNSYNSGAGGNGGDGICVVTTYF